MKTLFFVTLLLPVVVFSQSPFPNTPFDSSLETARREERMLMVQLYAPDCSQCNEVANRGLSGSEVREAIRLTNMIAVAYMAENADWKIVNTRYKLASGIATVFISPSGNILHRFYGSVSLPSAYAQHIKRAYAKQDDEKSIIPFEKAYQEGSRNLSIMEQLLQLRENLGWETSQLLDDYAAALPEDSLRSLSQLQRLAGFAPELGSRADSLLRNQGDRFREAWYRMDLPMRSNINNRVIYKSKTAAITERNRQKINRVALFASSVQEKEYDKRRIYHVVMLDYFKALQDTMNVLSHAERFMEGLVMQVSPDSIKLLDSAAKEKMASEGIRSASELPAGADRPTTFQRSFTYAPKAQFYANDLNNTAFNVFTLTKDSAWTMKALRWSARSLEFYETSTALDTYARLLYRSGQRQQAIATQQKALELDIKRGGKGTTAMDMLKKMKAGEEL